MRWIPGNLIYGPEAQQIPYDELTVYDWCHLILCAHQVSPNGPASVTDEMRREINYKIVSRIVGDPSMPTDPDDEDDDDAAVVLPLAVFTRALAMLAALSSSSNALISGHISVTGGIPESSIDSPIDFTEHPELTAALAMVTSISHLSAVMPAVTLSLRDTAGDIEIMGALVVQMSEALTDFADMDLIGELADQPLEPSFLGTLGDLAFQCSLVGEQLLEALEVAEIA